MMQSTFLPVVRSHSMTLAVLPDRLPVEALKNSMSVCFRDNRVLMRCDVENMREQKKTREQELLRRRQT
jgi:hypothetical protein